MGQKDTLLKRYFSDETRFADLINGVIGEGKELIMAAHVTDMDSQVGVRVPETRTQEEFTATKKNSDIPNKNQTPKYRDLIRKDYPRFILWR